MRNDDGVSARHRLLDRLADQRPDLVTAQLVARSERDRAAHRPRLAAALRDRVEHTGGERLASLLARNLRRLDPSLGSRSGDDLLIHVEEAEALGDESADLFATGTRGMGDADDCALHDDRRYEPARVASSALGRPSISKVIRM